MLVNDFTVLSFTQDVLGCGEKEEEVKRIKLFSPPYMHISDGSVWNEGFFFVKNTHFRTLDLFPGY